MLDREAGRPDVRQRVRQQPWAGQHRIRGSATSALRDEQSLMPERDMCLT